MRQSPLRAGETSSLFEYDVPKVLSAVDLSDIADPVSQLALPPCEQRQSPEFYLP